MDGKGQDEEAERKTRKGYQGGTGKPSNTFIKELLVEVGEIRDGVLQRTEGTCSSFLLSSQSVSTMYHICVFLSVSVYWYQ